MHAHTDTHPYTPKNPHAYPYTYNTLWISRVAAWNELRTLLGEGKGESKQNRHEESEQVAHPMFKGMCACAECVCVSMHVWGVCVCLCDVLLHSGFFYPLYLKFPLSFRSLAWQNGSLWFFYKAFAGAHFFISCSQMLLVFSSPALDFLNSVLLIWLCVVSKMLISPQNGSAPFRWLFQTVQNRLAFLARSRCANLQFYTIPIQCYPHKLGDYGNCSRTHLGDNSGLKFANATWCLCSISQSRPVWNIVGIMTCFPLYYCLSCFFASFQQHSMSWWLVWLMLSWHNFKQWLYVPGKRTHCMKSEKEQWRRRDKVFRTKTHLQIKT